MKKIFISALFLILMSGGSGMAQEYSFHPHGSKSKVSLNNISTDNTMGALNNTKYMIPFYDWQIDVAAGTTAARVFLLGSVDGTVFFAVDEYTYAAGTVNNAAAVDVGGGVVGVPYTGHGFTYMDNIVLDGSTNYEGTYLVLDSSTADQINVIATYAAETFAGTEVLGFSSVFRHVLNRRVKMLKVFVESVTGSITVTTIPAD